MKRKMGKLEYIFINSFWTIISMRFYQSLVFMPLEGSTARTSKFFLWGLVIVLVSLGILITFKRQRNALSTVANILFPYQIYSTVVYWNYFNTWINITLIALVILSGTFFLAVVFSKTESGAQKNSTLIKNRLKGAFLGSRIVAVACLSAFILPLSIGSFVGMDLFLAKDSSTLVYNEPEKWTIPKNADTIMKTDPKVWETLTLQERLDVLNVLKNIEMSNLGINHEIYLSADNLDEYILGQYNPKEHKIVLNVMYLKNYHVDEIICTLAHECHHAYSIQQANMYNTLPTEYKNMPLFDDARQYAKEYADYANSDADYFGYATQICEIDADIYGERALKRYRSYTEVITGTAEE